MGIIIILFFIATVLAFMMLSFRAWEIKTRRIEAINHHQKIIPEMYFRHLEKIMLHLIKRGIQWVLLIILKGWFIVSTKTKKWVGINWPRIYKFFRGKKDTNDSVKTSFIKKAVWESKVKIRRMKEKIKREQEEKLSENQI